jgi:FkbM family methyltransferase
MRILGRSLGRIVGAPFHARHWVAAMNMAAVYEHPLDAARRYALATGSYPHTFVLRTPSGPVEATAYSFDDVLTINEIFCRGDYRIGADDRVVVDFGSNIGISALYFLTHAPNSIVYCHEPLPSNCERLHQTLKGFTHRYRLSSAAVAVSAGRSSFSYEPTGRYGKLDGGFGERLDVECLCARDIIAAVLKAHSHIDVLKIDIEGLERDVLLSLTPDQLERIEKIHAETLFDANPFARTHTMRQYGTVAQFFRHPA